MVSTERLDLAPKWGQGICTAVETKKKSPEFAGLATYRMKLSAALEPQGKFNG